MTIIAQVTIPYPFDGYRQWTVERLATDGVWIYDKDTERNFETGRKTFIPEPLVQAMLVGLMMENMSKVLPD